MDLAFAPRQIEFWPIERLRPYARNAKMHGADQVAVVSPEGVIEHYGQAAFNYSDADLAPGTRVAGEIARPAGRSAGHGPAGRCLGTRSSLLRTLRFADDPARP